MMKPLPLFSFVVFLAASPSGWPGACSVDAAGPRPTPRSPAATGRRGAAASAATRSVPAIRAGGFPRAARKVQPSERKFSIRDAYAKWYRLSEVSRFLVSGNIGTALFYLMEKIINAQLVSNASSLPDFADEYRDTVSFFVGYLLQIVMQHSLNAFLVYGLETIDTREKYLKTLAGQYSAYGASLIGSTVLNLVLLRAGLDRAVAFFTTMAVFAVFNFFVVGWIVRAATAAAAESKRAGGAASTTSKKRETGAKKKRAAPRGGGSGPWGVATRRGGRRSRT